MSVTWTKEQQQVIDARAHNLLVSAAAGSGKTAVLVERIINRILGEPDPVDIDRLLVVTFTKAAAAQMRERIAAAIDKKREEFPENERLERQQALIHNAQITTIDSFCSFVVRNHFEEISLDPNFRVADTGELRLLEMDVLEEVFETYYASEDNEGFLALADAYSGSRSDQAVKDMVSQIYHMSSSHPWPREWMIRLAESYRIESVEDLLDSAVMQEICSIAKVRLLEAKEGLVRLRDQAAATDGLQKYADTLNADLELFSVVEGMEDYSGISDFFRRFKMGAIAQIRKFNGDAARKEYIKDERNRIKKELEELKKRYFAMELPQLLEQIQRIRPMVEKLTEVSLCYLEKMAQRKQEKRIVDFSDMEHFALNILVDEKTKELRPAAVEFQQHFEEIMIDEYQDSNQVQEAIMQAISRECRGEHNLFMVGDVKQSIYRFRLARPELFMEKYRTYDTTGNSGNLRIDLHQNFRSRQEVLDFSNDIFYKIMQMDLGNVAYDADAALYGGASYPEDNGMEAEVLLYDLAKTKEEQGNTSAGKAGRSIILQEENSRRVEARLIAQRIQNLMKNGRITDKATGKLREIHYRDIVILLRSLKGWDLDFSEVLEDAGIPVHVESSTGYFSAVEVQVLLSFLQILDNPFQDIPMAAVLKSPMVGLGEEDLAKLRAADRKQSFSQVVWDAMENAREGPLSLFFSFYTRIRELVADTPIHELIQRILWETGYGNYVAALPAGKKRAANLDMLVEKAIAYEQTSYKGLFHFVRYIEELKKYDVDFGEADITGENEDVVRIMTIHKSKGLEFPVVFLAGTSKKFNQMDSNQKMVLHPDLGMGLYEIQQEPKRKRNCLIRTEIADRIRRENLGEELRVLYVALTRAKEKLILTGTVKDWEKTLEKYTANVIPQKALSFSQRAKAVCYLDWIIPALQSYPEKYKISCVEPEKLILEEVRLRAEERLDFEQLNENIQKADDIMVEELKRRFSYVYPYQSEAGRKSKYSVSELKHDSMLEQYDRSRNEAELPEFLREEKESFIPEFAKRIGMQEEEISPEKEKKAQRQNRIMSEIPGISPGALRGTAVHRIMECLEFSGILNMDISDEEQAADFVKEQMDRMLQQERITREMYDLVSPSMIETFVKDPIALRMARAEARGELFREKPFVMDHEGVLIQGIIDVFWLEEDRIILLDYKTDAVRRPQELVDRYKTQLDLYGDALERIFSREESPFRVQERLVYSFRLRQVISMNP